MTKIYLLRHGDILNPNQILYLQMDKEIALSERGKQQITTQAKKLKKKLISFSLLPITYIYHSPLLRTTQTAQITAQIFNTKHLTPDSRLIDSANPAQGIPMADFDKKYQGDLYHPELTAKGGETMQQIQNRMLKALQSYVRKHPNQNIIAVSHGDPIRIIQMTTQNLKLTKPNLGSDRHPTPEIQYPEKGSLTILKTKNNRLIQLDYWPPPTISSG